MFSVFGDESSSTRHATYGLVAIADNHLGLLGKIVDEAKHTLGASMAEPLHAKVLFHNDRRLKTTYKNAQRSDVERACAHLFRQICRLEIGFYFGQVEREKAPKIMHVPLNASDKADEVIEARMKLELSHLQFFAYAAAFGRARHALRGSPTRMVVDQNKSVIRWFNQNRQANRLLELMGADATLPEWPQVTFADDADHPGVQVVDLLTYYATKQYTDGRFSRGFDSVRHKTQVMTFEFAQQTYKPFIPPANVSVKSFGKK